MKLEKVIELYPKLYHMAEAGSWPSIKRDGLLSSKAVLERSVLSATDKKKYESEQRCSKVEVPMQDGTCIVLRDQIPMPPNRLAQALEDNITPEEWYESINAKVFFWTSEERLQRLLNARQYRKLDHDVLVIDTKSMVNAHQNKIWLCHMNSGNTFPMPHKRGANTFCRVSDYPSKSSGLPVKPVVEFLVDHSVPDISDHVIEIRHIAGVG